MQLRVAHVPFSEIVLVVFLATSSLLVVTGRFFSIVNPAPFFVWWAFGAISVTYYFLEYGIWALRDATNLIESLYILVGFSVFGLRRVRRAFLDKYPLFILILCVYGLTFPLGESLRAISPKIVSGSGSEVSVFFTYTNSYMMLLVGALYLMVKQPDKHLSNTRSILLASLLLVLTIGFFQARTIYLQIIAISVVLMIVRPAASKRWMSIIFGCLVLMLILSIFGIEIEGRLGEKLSVSFLLDHFLAIFGVESNGLEGSASGVGQRLGWWLHIYDWWSEKLETIVFGLGYGFPLIDFGIGNDVVAREPHNSFISILARSGVLGFAAWIWFHFSLFYLWVTSYAHCKRVNWNDGEVLLIVLLGYFLLIWCLAIGEDSFEKPFNSVPYYFFWGVVARIAWHVKRGEVGCTGVVAR